MSARWVLLACSILAGACGGKAHSERRHSGDGSSGMGGTTTGGSAGATTGGSSTGGSGESGGTGVGGTGVGGNGSGGSAGSTSGGSSTGGEGGAPGGSSSGGTSSGGEGGAGNCVDVCALHGAACCIPNVACVDAETSCTVEVLAGKVITFYDYARFEQDVAALPQDLLLSFTDADVVWAATDPVPSARMELHMTPELAALHGEALETANNSPFRVSCNGRQLFVGVIYLVYGAAAFDLPVLHVELDDEGELILRLGARQGGVWPELGPSVDTELRERIDRADLRGALCLRGALREL